MFDREKLRKLKEDFSLGYLGMNLVNPPVGAYWGKYNDRELDDTWVKKLCDSFSHDLDNCDDNTAIAVAIDMNWLSKESIPVKSIAGKTIDDIPMVQFTEDGQEAIRPNNLFMLGGNHRRAALKMYVEALKNKEEDRKQRIAILEKETTKHAERIETQKAVMELEKLRAEAKQKEETIKSAGKWVIELFDRGVSHLMGIMAIADVLGVSRSDR
jgi:hypothetical protein